MDYLGANLPALVNSTLVATLVKDELTRDEASLYKTKWFDYRWNDTGPVHPLEASRMFAEQFCIVYSDYYKRRVDQLPRDSKIGLDKPDLMRCKKRQISGIWKARQTADRYGVKYDFWCWAAFKYIEKFNWAQLPRPNQLYSTRSKSSDKDGFKSVVAYVLHQWKEHCETNLVYAESSFYRLADAERPYHPYQREHMHHLWNLIERSVNPHLLVATLVLEKGLLTPQLIRAKFGEKGAEMLRRAEKFVA